LLVPVHFVALSVPDLDKERSGSDLIWFYIIEDRACLLRLNYGCFYPVNIISTLQQTYRVISNRFTQIIHLNYI
jgi:hypothetical protein